MRILLINLPTEGQTNDFTTRDYVVNDFYVYPPLALLSIASDIDKKHEVKVIDILLKKLTIDQTVQRIKEYNPDVLGISIVTRQLYAAYEVCRKVKEINKDITIVAGGPHINNYAKKTMGWGTIDYALTGYCEFTFPQLIEAIDKNKGFSEIPSLYYKSGGKIQNNPPDKKPMILDDFPFPDRSLVNMDNYFIITEATSKMTTLNSSRGCPFSCIYCDVQDKEFHYKSAKRLVDEMEEVEKMGIKEIYIFDDTFNILRQRVIDVCNEYIKRGLKVKWSTRWRATPFDREMAALLKKAGCIRLHVGIESLDPKILKFMKKNITVEDIENFFDIVKEFKIEVMAYFMMGFPGETKEYRKNFLNDVKRLNPDYFLCGPLCPLPNTQYYNMLLENGTYKKDFWKEFIERPTRDFKIPLPRSEEEQREIENLIDVNFRKYYFRPKRMFKELRSCIFSPKVLALKSRTAINVLRASFRKDTFGVEK